MVEVLGLLAGIARPEAPYRLRRRLRVPANLGRVAALLAIFLVTYAAVRQRGRLGPTSDAVLGRLLSPWGALGPLAIFFAGNLAWQRSQRQLLQQNNEAMILPAANRVGEAAQRYDDLVRRARSQPLHHALFVGNRGAIAFHQGLPERARVLLAEALRSGHFTQSEPDGAGAYFAVMLGRTHLQLGQLDEAASWREVASALAPPNRRALVRLLDAALLLRRGQPAPAAQQIESGWMGSEGELSAHERRHLRALHAFALSQLPSREDDCHRVLAALDPPMPELLASACAGWPELEHFLRLQGLRG
jgi:tetratricopeptide (TPR) repeat protein